VKRAFRSAVGLAQHVAYGRPPKEGAPAGLDAVPLVGLDGRPMEPSVWEGKVVLFVNVASRCGLTPQYKGLQALYTRFADRGFTLVGVPCNQFLGQEPGSAEEIAEFCEVNFGVTFPLLEKQDVNGAGRSPLYQWLVGSAAGRGEDIGWNFEKFVVGRDGEVKARFAPDVKPADEGLIAALEAELGPAGS
jgi:glutathione peroxidase